MRSLPVPAVAAYNPAWCSWCRLSATPRFHPRTAARSHLPVLPRFAHPPPSVVDLGSGAGSSSRTDPSLTVGRRTPQPQACTEPHRLHLVHSMHSMHSANRVHSMHGVHGVHSANRVHNVHNMHNMHGVHSMHSANRWDRAGRGPRMSRAHGHRSPCCRQQRWPQHRRRRHGPRQRWRRPLRAATLPRPRGLRRRRRCERHRLTLPRLRRNLAHRSGRTTRRSLLSSDPNVFIPMEDITFDPDRMMKSCGRQRPTRFGRKYRISMKTSDSKKNV